MAIPAGLEHVLSPLTIKGVTLRNRVVRTAHGTNIGRGRIDDDLIAYHLARAEGGVGLSIVEAASVHATDTGTLRLHDESCVADTARLMAAIRPTGMKHVLPSSVTSATTACRWTRPGSRGRPARCAARARVRWPTP